ncbi:autotransporter outer membrane beta-barrel domain-containing protein [Sphingobium sp. CR2-8]|uniref:autotransporter outer membrane beta-barrel domain-containing protein n=1 Tax=Sphingobium sp. CR2-8 TaxID=1306534 RepID=UPI002DBDCA6D|nr:autotransporter outer membrane beta-barrel domain-containing protein [Sphingobium sp. CR2-8]MEC3912801.1 autotransporter outer membrane beta-barrel domain-containing protein [Sphingobium sp. CR2-8]
MLSALLVADPAFAACTPDPTVANATNNCTDTDSDGLIVDAANSRIVVAQGATVRPGNAAAAILSRSTSANFEIRGLVDGGVGKPGLFVTTGPVTTRICGNDPYAGASPDYCFPGSTVTVYPSANASISVMAGGTITGAQGIVLRRDPNNDRGFISATIDNAGTITGTAGPAIVADQGNFGTFSINNRATGGIGGITGNLSYLTNAGTIDGGSSSAVASTYQGLYIANTGRIVSNGQAPTVSAPGYLVVSNAANSVIGGGTTAIRTTGGLSLTNSGTISGSVISTAAGGQGSMIDTRSGTINGNLALGAGDDTLRARYHAASGRISSITGLIDGGGGTDTIELGVDADATFRTVALPVNFERLGFDLANNATVTLEAGFTSGTAIQIGGTGTVVNQAALATNGPAITIASLVGNPQFENRGSIVSTMSSSSLYAVRAQTITNSGTITANGGAGASVDRRLTNSGTITASGTAAMIGYGVLTNSGTIRSTGANGVSIYASDVSTNSGTIAGATSGLTLTSGSFTNSGTITSGNSGVMLWSGRLTNSGAISGGTTGVSIDGGTLLNGAMGRITGGILSGGSRATIANSGQITGTVNLASPYSLDSNNDIFIDNGGSVTGAIRLGGGDDQLVVDLDSAASRPLAGAAGGVDAGAGWDLLRYRVKGDAGAALALINGFEALAYELWNDAKLTLSTAAPIVATIGLAGNGTVTLNGSVSIADRNLIDATIPTTDQLTGVSNGLARALTIVNDGTLTLTANSPNNAFSILAAISGGSADISNNGTISVTSAAGRFYPAMAISGGTSVTNTGAISLTGNATAISNVRTVVNGGTITDSAGANATGVTGFTTLTNSGTIRVDGVAAQSGYNPRTSLTNSGTIESRRATAVMLSYGSRLTNEATGTIRGATAIDLSSGGTVVNRGAIVGNITTAPYSYSPSVYIADGGTLTGNLTFGQGSDLFIQTGDSHGVTGTIDGGAGFDVFGYSRKASGTIALGNRPGINFEADYVEALGADTSVTLTAANRIANDLYLQGDGTIVNDATIDGAVLTYLPIFAPGVGSGMPLAALNNRGTILRGVNGDIRSFMNSGTVGSRTLATSAVSQWLSSGALLFDNSGTIASSGVVSAVSLGGQDLSGASAVNSGTIDGGTLISAAFAQQAEPARLAIDNRGTISNANGTALVVSSGSAYYPAITNGAAAVALANSGTITASGNAGVGVSLQVLGSAASTYVVDNRGTIRASGDGVTGTYRYYSFPGYVYTTAPVTDLTTALSIQTANGVTGTIANAGTIETSRAKSVALLVSGTGLDLTNSGTIRGGGDTLLAANDLLARSIGLTTVAGAIQTIGTADDRIVNTGTIIGSIDLGRGNDRIENYGRIEGHVRLGAGDDIFLQAADALLIGTVDGGEGTDRLIVDATRGGAVDGDQFVNFERFSQIGNGSVAYSGTFRFDTIGLSGGTVTVAAGQTLSSAGATTIAGGDAAETVINAGTIAGHVDLGAGNDRVVNSGAIGGEVLLGAGDDQFVDIAGSSVAGGIDGGAGNDLYTVMLAGNRSGIGRRTGFERLSVKGNGTLALTLDQNFEAVALNGTGLNLTLNGFAAGVVTGTDAAETLSVDGDIAVATMGAGDDVLALGTKLASGLYAGGAGADIVRFTVNAPVTLAGMATGFESVALTGGALTVIGTLGATNERIGFGDGGQSVTVARGGTIAGIIDLGGGDDSFRLSAGATLAGTVSGGSGTDTAILELAGDRTLGTGLFTDFEILGTEGSGTLTLTGTHAYQRVAANTGLTVAAGASLNAPVTFGAGDNRFTIAGAFAGSVDGGAGNDVIQLSGGSSAATVAFANVANVEALGMSGGFATVSGSAAFGTIDLSGGRLVGLAGSIINAGQIAVRSGATFGSAGTVNGNIAVSGTLSPGASPGVMTVNGNVALASGSTSLFEITPTIADQLRVNGDVTIASGATLRIVAEGQIRPGTSYDLIVASGGITGNYTTIDKAASLFGFVVQRADRIQLLGQFLDNAAFSPQVSRSIAYANTAIQAQPATSPLFAALPTLLLANGASDPRGFARLTPEPYASATQLGVDQALTLVDTARGPGFAATDGDDVHGFTFGQAMGQWHRLSGNAGAGTSGTQTHGYGLIGGIGIGNRDWSIGALGGYLDSRQRIGALDASNRTYGFVAGVHGRYAANGLQVSASALFDGGEARTTRALPNGDTAFARYDLRSLVGDLSVGYAMSTGGDWALTPKVGVTYVRTIRDRATETGSLFGLTVARDRHDALFGDAGFRFARADSSDAAFRPYVGLGLRAQYKGRVPTAIGGYARTPTMLIATGAQRAKMVGAVSAGMAYRLEGGLELFSAVDAQTGSDNHRESMTAGVRLRF